MIGVLNLSRSTSEIAIAVALSTALAALWFAVPEPFLPVGAALGIACLAGAIARPFLVCLAFLALSFFRIHEAYPVLYPLRLPLVLGCLTIATLFWQFFGSRSNLRPFLSSELSAFLILFALVTINLAFALSKQRAWTLYSETYWKIGAMTLVFAWLPRRAEDFRLASGVFASCGAAVGLVAIRNKLSGIDLVEGTRVTIGRDLDSVLGDPNDLALTLLFPFSFALVLAFRSKSWTRRIIGILSVAIICGGIISTQSRGGLIGMLAVMAAFLFSVSRSKVKCAFILSIAAVFLYAGMGITSREIGGASDAGLDVSAQERLDTWKAAISMAMYHPLTGVGLNNFSDVFFFYTDSFQGHGLATHSTWFSVLGELGVPGLVAFVLIIVRSFTTVTRAMRYFAATSSEELQAIALALFAALLGFCASGTFLSQAYTWPVYVLIGLIAALGRLVPPSPGPARHEDAGTTQTTWSPDRSFAFAEQPPPSR